MSDGSQFDPIFSETPVPVHGGTEHEHRESGSDWVVVHRGGATIDLATTPPHRHLELRR